MTGLLSDLNGNASGPGPGAGSGDFDADSVSDFQEWQYSLAQFPGISPVDADSDDDDLQDGEEIAGAGDRDPTSPVNADSDNDGLSDKAETNTGTYVSADDTGSNPLVADTDSDGYRDGFENLRSGDPNDAAIRPVFSPPVSMTLLTDDASTEVSTDKTYTHAVAGGGGVVLNGVTFEELSTALVPENVLWDTGEFDRNIVGPVNNNGWIPLDGGVTGTQLIEMLGAFTYSANGNLSGRQQTYTLTGLTPGQSYLLRLYIRPWATGGSGRPIDLRFINGGETSYAPILEDRPHLTFPEEALISPHAAYALDYEYVATGTELVIEAQVPVGSAAPSGSLHLYALTNEVSFGSGPPEIISIDRNSAGPSVTFEFTSIPGAAYFIEASGDLENWIELDDGFDSQGTRSTFTDNFRAGNTRQYYRVTRLVGP